MRITQNALFNQLRHRMESNSARLMRAQEIVATQKKLNRLSDSPVDGARVVDVKQSLGRIDQYLRNLDRLDAVVQVQDATLGEIGDLLVRAKELLLQESNEVTSTKETREAARLEIVALLGQLTQIANTRFNGESIFAGSRTGGPAFVGATVATAPNGVSGGAAVTAAKVYDDAALIPGEYRLVFTAPDQFELREAVSGDLILAGQPYVSGQPIRFHGVELVVTNGSGAPAAGDRFDVTISPPGAYQGDSQVARVDIQADTRADKNIPGDRLFQGAGVANGVDLFDVMNRLNAALRTNDRAAMDGLLNDLDAARVQVSNERTRVGAQTNLLEGVRQRHLDVQLSLEAVRGNLEDADLAEAITQLTQQQTIYEATLGAAAGIVQPSLLDFLR